jgi:hypothetical protein
MNDTELTQEEIELAEQFVRTIRAMAQSLLEMHCMRPALAEAVCKHIAGDDPRPHHLAAYLAGLASRTVRALLANAPDAQITFHHVHLGPDGVTVAESPEEAPPEHTLAARLIVAAAREDGDTARALTDAFFDQHPERVAAMLALLVRHAHTEMHKR